MDLRSDELEAEVARLIERGAVELHRTDTNVTMADLGVCIAANAV